MVQQASLQNKAHMKILCNINGISNAKIMLTHEKELFVVDLYRR